jgi:putative sigma-54 modulation protein
MQFHFTGKNIDVTDALAIYATEKLSVLEHRDNNIEDIHVILMVERAVQTAEATLHLSGTTLHAKAETDDMYKSIKELAEKLVTQVSKHKDRGQEDRRN